MSPMPISTYLQSSPMNASRYCCLLRRPGRFSPTPLRFNLRGYASENPGENKLLQDYLRRQAEKSKDAKDTPDAQRTPERGGLAPSSIFESDDSGSSITYELPGKGDEPPRKVKRDPSAMAAKLDPVPTNRKQWERKKMIQSIRKRGRLTKVQRIKRTEREQMTTSAWEKTSVKKMGPLARQIAGKSIEDAIVQMTFSKKKAAIAVKKHLQEARNKAIVERGMGLGEAENRKGDPFTIHLKDGTRHKVTDHTGIYVDQAWVTKGPYGQDRFGRARGRVDRLRLPQTAVSVLLKEEVTRVRLHNEREQKRRDRKPWVQLPDRPITAQRPYYSW